jgi:hypothetical protein
MVVGLPVAAAVYMFLYRSFDLTGERLRVATADLGLEPAERAAL